MQLCWLRCHLDTEINFWKADFQQKSAFLKSSILLYTCNYNRYILRITSIKIIFPRTLIIMKKKSFMKILIRLNKIKLDAIWKKNIEIVTLPASYIDYLFSLYFDKFNIRRLTLFALLLHCILIKQPIKFITVFFTLNWCNGC